MNTMAPDEAAEEPAVDLDTRIAGAFRDGITSSKVPKLIEEVRYASAAASSSAERAHKRALDPALETHDVFAARREMEEIAFRRDRLEMAVERLKARLDELKQQEENERRQIAYEKVKAERDALADELAKIYPRLRRS